MLIDIFQDDAFSLNSLTQSINHLPYVPNRLGELNLFQEEGVASLSVIIEEQFGKLSLIKTAARGTMPTLGTKERRKMRSFLIPHLPQNDNVLADDAQGVRAFGTESELETVLGIVNNKMEKLKQNHELTWEWHRLGAIKGQILDADAETVIYDLFDEFGITQKVEEFDFEDESLDVKDKCIKLKRYIDKTLGASTYQHIHVLCGDDFFDALVAHPNVKEAYEQWENNGQGGTFLREDQRAGFEHPAGVVWENYRGFVGTQAFIEPDEAYAFPIGVPDLFIRRNGPAPFVETVNTIGIPLYAKQEPMKFGLGTELHTNSNPLHLCTRPAVLVKLQIAGGSTVSAPVPAGQLLGVPAADEIKPTLSQQTPAQTRPQASARQTTRPQASAPQK
jgi:hypothetical protein